MEQADDLAEPVGDPDPFRDGDGMDGLVAKRQASNRPSRTPAGFAPVTNASTAGAGPRVTRVTPVVPIRVMLLYISQPELAYRLSRERAPWIKNLPGFPDCGLTCGRRTRACLHHPLGVVSENSAGHAHP